MTGTRIGFGGAATAAFVITVASLSAGCGSLLPWSGGGGSSATVAGNLDVFVPLSDHDVVAFVFTVKDPETDCKVPVLPDSGDPDQSVVIPNGETAFELDGVKTGRLVVVFLLDNAGDAADGQIDDGDPIAILDDPNCELTDVAGKTTVNLTNVRMNFTDAAAVGFPAPGRAVAADITVTDDNAN
jgi:hypothetical protein